MKFNLRGDWSIEEDLFLLENILKNGKKWALISKQMVSRNENTVKNRYFSLIKRFLKGKPNRIIDENQNIMKMINKLKNISLLQNDTPSSSPSISPKKKKNTRKSLTIETPSLRHSSKNPLQLLETNLPVDVAEFSFELKNNTPGIKKNMSLEEQIPKPIYEIKKNEIDVVGMDNIIEENIGHSPYTLLNDEYNDLEKMYSSMSISDQMVLDGIKVLNDFLAGSSRSILGLSMSSNSKDKEKSRQEIFGKQSSILIDKIPEDYENGSELYFYLLKKLNL